MCSKRYVLKCEDSGRGFVFFQELKSQKKQNFFVYVPISKYEILHGTFLRPDFTKSP